MAILISSRRSFVVDCAGVVSIVACDARRTILPDIVSTLDDWRLDGIDDADYLDDDWQEGETIENFIERKHNRTATGLRNETAKERASNNGTTDGEELERLANLERYALRGYAFERPIGDDKFDDFDTREQCEESYRFDDAGNEV